MSTKTIVGPLRLASLTRSMPDYSPLASLCLLVSDLVGLSIVFWLAIWVKYLFNHDVDFSLYLQIYPVVAVFFVAFFAQGLYPGLLLHPAEEMRRVFHAVSAVMVIFAAAVFLRKSGSDYSRFAFVMTWAFGTPVVVLGRTLVRNSFGRMRWWAVSAVVLGSAPAVERIARSLQKAQLGIHITGVLLEGATGSWDSDLPPILGHMSQASLADHQSLSRYAILAMPNRSHAEIRQTIQDHCKSFHRLLVVTDIPGLCCLGISPREIGGQVGLEIPQRLRFVGPKIIKRCLDLAVSSLLLAALFPLLLLICIAIKITSNGPALFGHRRYGRDGRIFKALKFRTMVSNADQILDQHLRSHPELLAEWQRDHKLKNDPRITWVGRWLRRYSLDELPQLLNILVGQMSLVGPRPIVQSEIPRYADSYELYTRVTPGLTGLWQVSGRNNTTYQERVAFDEYYIRNWSIWMDMYIIGRTFQVVLLAHGAY